MCYWRARPAVRGAGPARTSREGRQGAPAGRPASAAVFAGPAVTRAPGGRAAGDAERAATWAVRRPGEDRTARLRPGAGGRDRGAPPGLARRVGSRSLAGSQGGNQTLRVAGERVSGGAPFLITVISSSGRPELRVLRGAGWLGDGGFPEEILETVCGSIGAFWSPRVSSAL